VQKNAATAATKTVENFMSMKEGRVEGRESRLKAWRVADWISRLRGNRTTDRAVPHKILFSRHNFIYVLYLYDTVLFMSGNICIVS
jgi:hypothetical protein